MTTNFRLQILIPLRAVSQETLANTANLPQKIVAQDLDGKKDGHGTHFALSSTQRAVASTVKDKV